MSHIPPSFLQELLAHTDIVELIKHRIKLSRAGHGEYKALCPFHHEKTPSFTVSQKKQFYHCFGCGASGNAIGFMMAYDKLAFLDAIEQLASHTGLSIPRETSDPHEAQKRKLTDKAIHLLNEVTAYYQSQLKKNTSAQAYLKENRQLSDASIERYQIGYAPPGWNHLDAHFCSPNNPKHTALLYTGMLIKKDKTHTGHTTTYNRFRNRLMFPIRRVKDGGVIGFGARTLTNEEPKYLNSPETPLFHKGSELYGLYEACQRHKSLDVIVVVEGYMDVIALAQFGITYAVATLGTALSGHHFNRLQRYTKRIVFCFDGDKAGHRAAWRALTTALPKVRDELTIQFMFLPEGQDPDTLIRQEGKEAFIARAKKATPLADFFFNNLRQNHNANTIEGQASFAKEAKDLLHTLPNGIFKSLMMQQLAKLLGLPTDQLKSYLAQLPRKTTYKTPAPNTSLQNHASTNASVSIQAPLKPTYRLLALLLQKPSLITELTTAELSLLLSPTSDNTRQLLIAITEFIQHHPQVTTGAIIEAWREQPALELLLQLARWPFKLPEDTWKAEITGLLQQLKRHHQKKKIQKLLEKAQKTTLNTAELKTLQELLRQSKLPRSTTTY